MNRDLFTTFNNLAGQNTIVDGFVVFCANYLIYLLFAGVGVALVYLLTQKKWRPIILFCLSVGIAFVLMLIAEQLFPSDRPFVGATVTMLIEHEANQSFPSSHTAAAMAVALSLLCFTPFKKWGAVAVIAALLVGLSRIVAGVHFPLDIAGGIAVAVLGVVAAAIIARITRPKQPPMHFSSK